MATLRQIIVDTDSSYAGYDYSTLASAESTEQGDISLSSGTDEYVVFECYATSGTAEEPSTGVTIVGWTTEDGNYVEVNGLLDSSYGHRGSWDNGEYRIDASSASANTLTVEQDYTRIIGLQITASDATSSLHVRCRNGFGMKVEKCIVKHNTSGAGVAGIYMAGESGSAVDMYASNNIVYDIGNATNEGGMHGEHSGTGKVYFYNNTIYNCYTGIDTSASDTIAINNIVHDCTSEYNGTFDSTSGYNFANTFPVAGGAFGTTWATGTATSYASTKLVDSGGGFTGTPLYSIVENVDDVTYTTVTGVDSDTQLDLGNDRFDDGNEEYNVYTNMYDGNGISFNDEANDDFTLSRYDIYAIFKGKNLYADSNYPITDDILGNSRGASTTDNFDVGAHHSLKYTRVVDTDSGAGYDYTSLNSYESTEQADITTVGLGKIAEAECYATSGTNDIKVAIIGWTTEAVNYILVSGERLTGASWDSSKWRIDLTDDDAMSIGEDYVRLDAAQLGKIYSSDDTYTSCCSTSTLNVANDIRISNSIIRSVPGATIKYIGIDTLDANVNLTVWNTIIYDFPRRCVEFGGASLTLYNCTIEGSSSVDGVQVSNGDVVIKNCAIWNNSDDIDVAGASSSTIDTCATDDGDGDNPITPTNWADVFENWTSNDYRLKSDDTDLLDQGLSNPGSGLFSDDIIGTTRDSNWDVGAFEYLSAGATINFTGTISPVTLISGVTLYRIMSLSDTIAGVFDVSGNTLLRTMDITGTMSVVSSLTSSEITIIYVLNATSGGLAWGEETVTEGEIPAPWNVWSDGAGGIPTITGDQYWGVLSIDTPDEGRSNVYDFGNSVSRTYTLTLNRYGSGTGTPVVQIRGQNTPFLQDDVSPSWETYSTPVAKTWRYVQVRIDYS